MTRQVQFSLTMRGQEVEVTASVCPSEPDVGILDEYTDDFEITDTEGNVLDWELTDAEMQQVNEGVSDQVNDWGED